APTDEVRGEDPVREIHRVAQWDLEDAGPDLVLGRDRRRHRDADERIRQDETAPDGVEEPRAVEAGLLDGARAADQRLAGEGRAVRPRGRHADAESHGPTSSRTATTAGKPG